MGVSPVFHEVLFFLSVLFGMNAPIVGEQAIIEINLSDNTASLTYQKLITSNNKVSEAKSALKKLNETEDNNLSNMQLIDKTFFVEQEDLNMRVNFDYLDSQEEELLNYFGLFKNDKGNVVFELLDEETYITSNGEKLKKSVEWPKQASVIYLEIKANVVDKHEQESKVNLAEHWTNIKE